MKSFTLLAILKYTLICLLCSAMPLTAFADEHSESEHTHQGEHEHHDHEEPELSFSATELKEFGIQVTSAGSGLVSQTQDLTGEIIVAPEHLYHVVPRVSGVVRQVFKHLGDTVAAGDLLAILSSRELADAKAQFVATDSLLKLARTNLQREQRLYREKITAQQDYFTAKQVYAERLIKRNAAKQRLLALGLSEQTIRAILDDTEKDLTRYELKAPASGVIIKKHAVQGEVLDANKRSFTLANLSRVWANLTVYQKDLGRIKTGQKVLIRHRFDLNPTETMPGVISWISPILDERTRSAVARVVIDNNQGQWQPGLFINAQVVIKQIRADIVIPLTALQTIDGQTVVFIQHEDGDFEPQTVQTGRRDFQYVEIIQGLKSGQRYVSQHAFSLKAQLQKGSFGHGHSH